MVSAPLSAILREISAVLVACNPPDVLNSSITTFERDALNGNPTFVLRSSDSQVFDIGVKESCNV